MTFTARHHRREGLPDALPDALNLAALGWAVYPIRKSRWDEKAQPARWHWPSTGEGGHPRHSCTTDEAKIRTMDWSWCWVGVRPEPSGLVVVDCDKNHQARPGVDGVENWQRLCDRNGCPPAPFQVTPSGGLHFFFRRRRAARFRVGQLNGIDLFGKSGITVAGPGYAWVRTPVECPPPVAPGWLDRAVASGWRQRRLPRSRSGR